MGSGTRERRRVPVLRRAVGGSGAGRWPRKWPSVSHATRPGRFPGKGRAAALWSAEGSSAVGRTGGGPKPRRPERKQRIRVARPQIPGSPITKATGGRVDPFGLKISISNRPGRVGLLPKSTPGRSEEISRHLTKAPVYAILMLSEVKQPKPDSLPGGRRGGTEFPGAIRGRGERKRATASQVTFKTEPVS